MTALQLLINKWETEISIYTPNTPIYKAFIEEAKMYLILEKKQIKEAYKAGIWDLGCNNPDHDRYYNEIYNKQ